MKHVKHLTTLAVILASAALQSPLFARSCTGNGDLIGSFGFFASRSGFFLIGATPPGTTAAGAPILVPLPVTPPGTTGALTSSNTPWGKFVGNLAGNGVFSGAVRIYADGLGNLFTGSTTGGPISNSAAGSYTVGADCSVKMSLKDPFLTLPTTEPGIPAPTGPAVALEGELIDNGRVEAVVTGSGAAGATASLLKTAQFNGCTLSSISGSFGILGGGLVLAGASATGTSTGSTAGTTQGTTATTPATGAFTAGVASTLGTPFNLVGRFVADGSGNLIPDPILSPSTLTRTLTGAYTINTDCTGSGKLVDPTGITRSIDFVVVNPAAQFVSAPANTRQQLQFVFSDTGTVGGGTAIQQ
jgi:hypothetical protein